MMDLYPNPGPPNPFVSFVTQLAIEVGRGWMAMLVKLQNRLRDPGLTHAEGARKFNEIAEHWFRMGYAAGYTEAETRARMARMNEALTPSMH